MNKAAKADDMARLLCHYLTGYSSYCVVDLPPVPAGKGSAVGEDVLEQAEDRLPYITLGFCAMLMVA